MHLHFFLFTDKRELERVLSMEPWTFNNALIALKEVDGVNKGDVGEFRHTRLWVQVHNLPSEGMIEEIGQIIGDDIGVCERVMADEDDCCIGLYMRIRVLIDITKPFWRGARIRLGESGHIADTNLEFWFY